MKQDPTQTKEAVKRLTRRVPSEKVVKKQAEQIVSRIKVKDLKPNQYRLAERRYAKEAGELFTQGDVVGAFESKRKEYLNFELYRAAVDAMGS